MRIISARLGQLRPGEGAQPSACARWGRGRRHLRAALLVGVLTATLAGAALPVTAGATTTDQFHFYNYSQWPLKLNATSNTASGAFPGAAPPIGSILNPGQGATFEMVYYFGKSTYGDADYRRVDGPAGLVLPTFQIGGANTVNVACFLQLLPGACTPAAWTKGQTDATYKDPSGTVVNVPASDAQAQADVLGRQCVTGNASACAFALTNETEFYSPNHAVGSALINNTDESQETEVTITDEVRSSNSVKVGTEVGAKIGELVEAKVSAEYEHSWERTHTFEQKVIVDCPARHRCWITAVQPMYRDTGDFTLTLGNTTWHLPNVYFDSPDPEQQGAYQVDDASIPASEWATLPKGLTTQVTDRKSYSVPARTRIQTPRLSVSLTPPRAARLGTSAVLRVRVSQNQPRSEATEAAHDVRVQVKLGKQVVRRSIPSLSPGGQPRTLRLRLSMPRSARGRVGVIARVRASHARGAVARSSLRLVS
jgi:hypothetical protein